MIKIENDRMEKIKNIIPRWSDGFNVHIMSKDVKVPLKFMVQNQMYNYKNKF
jgi:hypothetical protein